jgi:glucose/mannose-6-phosphate isomerase
MNLDNYEAFPGVDPQDMLGEINGLPAQLEGAYAEGQGFDVPDGSGIQRILIAGMGGSAIGADLLSAYIAPNCSVPVQVLRDYNIPGWARGPDTLVVASSHSGNTEETLSAFEQATAAGCTRIAVSTNGQLAAAAQSTGATLWQFNHTGQPRAAVGYSFGLLLAMFARLGVIPDPAAEVASAVSALKTQQDLIGAERPAMENPAKRQAGQLMGRLVSVFGSELLEPVARRWKGQISEIAKAWAQFEALPEANHNTLAGIVHPASLFNSHVNIFLLADSYHARNVLRGQLTQKIFMVEGLSTDTYTAQGDTRLAQQWTTLHFGDYTAYYLAMAYDVDPTPVEAIEGFKAELNAAST